ncbi:hypothetical protein AW40_27015 [Kosakonia radicincitans UMEnt01/12]|uniref:hypothetical protein n=1 Tax=Kosakonia radicincitans TaxID=283686 RepID=UPI00046133A1|nr:hypothetical protein [Kosakonia radicincitans]KDE33511.1 hypothetical protein AW40_27015 [Kosakonia radicincitans UMEnt01/12]
MALYIYIPYRRKGGSEDLWSLISLENDLAYALACFRTFGITGENETLPFFAFSAGYICALYGLDAELWVSTACADVAMSVRRMATEIDEDEWLAGISQAKYERALAEEDNRQD